MLSAMSQGDGGLASGTAVREIVPRTRVDSGHVVDGDGIIRRVPKLAVRNRTSDESNGIEQAIFTNSDAGSENERSAPASSNSSQRVRTPLSARSISDDSVHERQQSSRQRQSNESSKAATNVGQTATKKKRGGLVNFLALKEPSTSAWAQFAEAEKEKARQKTANGSKPTTRAAAAASTQKLPDFVPKVNSKWDGLPESAHRKSEDSKSARRANRNSLISNATRDTTWTSHSAVSADSNFTKRAVATLSGKPIRDSVQSNTLSARTSSSQDSRRQPPALALEFGSDLVAEHVENTDDNLPQTFLRDPSPPPQLHELPDSTVPISPPELEGDDTHYFQELSASPPTSPRTPPTDGRSISPALIGVHYPELDSVAKEAELLGDTKTDAVIRANSSRRPVNFSRPQLQKRSPPPPALNLNSQSHLEDTALPSPAPRSDGVVLSPTLREPFLTDTFAYHSQATGHIPQRVASTLVKTTSTEADNQNDDIEREEDRAPVSPISPVSPLEHNPFQPPAIPDVTMRPATASTIDSTLREPDQRYMDPTPWESQSQVSLAHSIAPSELSEHWRMSPKERLGLGSKLRKTEVFSWEDESDRVAESSKGRLSPLPSPGLDSRKRLSWRSIGGKK